jgi:hypothetical protein
MMKKPLPALLMLGWLLRTSAWPAAPMPQTDGGES